jgi:transcriptional regulator with XRE-family HTH domain
VRKQIVGRLVALRKKSGHTAKEISSRLKKNKYYISKMENGVFFPTLRELENVLAQYNSTLEELFYDEFEKFHFEKELIEKLRKIGEHQRDIILGVLTLAFETRDKWEGK